MSQNGTFSTSRLVNQQNALYRFQFRSKPDEVVWILWTEFHLEEPVGLNKQCLRSYVEVIIIDYYNVEHVTGRYCGNVSPPDYTTMQYAVDLVFSSSESKLYQGFKGTYHFILESEVRRKFHFCAKMSPSSNAESTASFHEISQIIDHLFLSAAHVINHDSSRKRGINLIINATIEEPSLYLKNCDYVKIRISDHPFSRLDVFFDLVADKIKTNKDKGGRTLVHCVAGVSRSVTLCLAYMIKYERMNLRSAYKLVKSARPIARPNWGFWCQLIDYERQVTGSASVTLMHSKSSTSEEPVPYVYGSQEVKENVIQSGSAAAATYNVPKYYTRRSRSEHGMSPSRSQPVAVTPSTVAQTSSKFAAERFTDRYRPAFRSGYVTVSHGPISKTATITFGPERSLMPSSSTKYSSTPTTAFHELRSKIIVPLRSPFKAL